MKKHYSTIAALFLSAFVFQVFAENDPQRTVNIQKLPDGVEITIDGKADEAVWKKATKHEDFKLFKPEAAQHEGPADLAGYWQAIWSPEGIFVLVGITADDVKSDGTVGQPWTQDGVEIYFDMNVDNLADGGGKGQGDFENPDGALGHPQFVAYSGFTTSSDNIEYAALMGIPGEGAKAFLVQEENTYVVETFIPWTSLLNKDEAVYTPDPAKPIGFDICLIDNDNNGDQDFTRTRHFWSATDNPEPWENANFIALATLINEVVDMNTSVSAVSKSELTVFVENNVMIISKNINARLLNMAGQEVMKINGTSANVSGLKGAFILVTNDNKMHKKVIIK